MTGGSRWLVAIPLAAGVALAVFYDRFVGMATALVIGGALLLPSRRRRTLRHVILDTVVCAAAFALVRELLWRR